MRKLDDRYKRIMESGNKDPEELYAVIYKMVERVARGRRLFRYSYNYPDFCTYMTGSILVRVLDEDKSPIRSMNAYIGFTWRGFYDVFIKQEFPLIIDTTIMEDGPLLAESLETMIYDQVTDSTPGTEEIEESSFIRSIPKILKIIIDKSIYGNSKYKEWLHLKIIWGMLYPDQKFNIRLPDHIEQYSELVEKRLKEQLYENIKEMIREQSFTYGMIRRANYLGNVEGDGNE